MKDLSLFCSRLSFPICLLLKTKMMEIGHYFFRDEAIKDGYHFFNYFAYCLVYQKDHEYIFVDIQTNLIKAILISE
jgi:hypothetical protein